MAIPHQPWAAKNLAAYQVKGSHGGGRQRINDALKLNVNLRSFYVGKQPTQDAIDCMIADEQRRTEAYQRGRKKGVINVQPTKARGTGARKTG